MSLSKKKTGFKIKPYQNRMDPESTWLLLQTGFKQIYGKNASSLSFEELYRNAYNMVIYKYGRKLYDGVRTTISEYLMMVRQERIEPSLPNDVVNNSAQELGFLKKLKEAWEEHETCLRMISDVLMYLDRTYLKQETLPYVYPMGQNVFRDSILHHPQIQKCLVDSLLHQIDLERRGEMVDHSLLKRIIEMLLNFDEGQDRTYHTIFETELLKATAKFYKDESSFLFNDNDAPRYFVKVSERLLEEEERAARYLSTESLLKITGIIDKEMLEANAKFLLEMDSGLVSMITNKKVEDLKRVYSILQRIPAGIPELKAQLSSHVRILARNINNCIYKAHNKRPSSASSATENGHQESFSNSTQIKVDHIAWVQSMLLLKSEYDRLVAECFQHDKSIEVEIYNTLECIINENSRGAEFISLFLDENLKKGLKGKSEEEVEALLDQAIVLFRFLREKDVFDRYYKQHLAKRLLLGRSVGEDAERSMISKLKMECGYQFTSKLEGMFTDMKISKDIMDAFNSKMNESEASGPTLHVQVLTSTFWPLVAYMEATSNINYPQEISALMRSFEKFYLSRHSGRKISWLPHMGTSDIRVHFEKGRKEINTIQDVTGIPTPDLIRTLQSLSLGKYRILIKSTRGKQIVPADTFKFNTEFTAPLTKIKIPTISSGNTMTLNGVENDEERIRTLEKVDEARKHQVEAAIVRIMKSRKSMDHSNLVAEVIDQLKSRFIPSPAMVKKRIEGLIEREYLDRDKGDIKKYVYLA